MFIIDDFTYIETRQKRKKREEREKRSKERRQQMLRTQKKPLKKFN